ncbi:FecR domain-containing protein [Devosia sp. 2618]|uniref:FecR family protein n=1 Tax=Devosia sp. 2618 TaxID=3156454 RepID=UPI0033965263
MKQLFFTPLLALFLMICVPNAFAANEGKAVGVNPDAVARVTSKDRILQAGSDVSVGETIVTGSSGTVQIVFADQTRLVVGPGSALRIETYLLASNNRAQKLAIDALGGTFRFVSGNSAKSAYSINTPTAAIAVRGTKFDFIVQPRSTRVMLYEGALQLCASGRNCADLTKRCEIGVASGGQSVLYRRDAPERLPLSLDFRYARFQAGLLSAFRVNGAASCAEGPSSAESLSTMEGSPGERDTGQTTP